MTSQNKAILDDLLSIVNDSLATVNKIQGELNYQMDVVRDLQRQAEVHRANNDNYNLQIVNVRLTAAYSERDAVQNKLNDAKANYQTALKNYEEAKNRLLTPEEKAAYTLSAQAELTKAQSDANKQLFAQKTTKYLIWGAVAILVIAIGVWIYRKKYAA